MFLKMYQIALEVKYFKCLNQMLCWSASMQFETTEIAILRLLGHVSTIRTFKSIEEITFTIVKICVTKGIMLFLIVLYHNFLLVFL